MMKKARSSTAFHSQTKTRHRSGRTFLLIGSLFEGTVCWCCSFVEGFRKNAKHVICLHIGFVCHISLDLADMPISCALGYRLMGALNFKIFVPAPGRPLRSHAPLETPGAVAHGPAHNIRLSAQQCAGGPSSRFPRTESMCGTGEVLGWGTAHGRASRSAFSPTARPLSDGTL